jgi:hypothetical protein
MLEFDNKVELLSYTGSDITHCEAILLKKTDEEELKGDGETIMRYLRSVISKGNYEPYNVSSITFLLKLDIYSYITILRSKFGYINDEPFKKQDNPKQFYVPFDWHDLKVLDNINEYAKKGDYWYNVILRYSELGYSLQQQFREEFKTRYSKKRSNELCNLFKPFNSQTDFSITFTFKSFVDFYNLSQEYNSTIELQDVGREMLELVKKIDGRPFSRSIRAFNLSKE